MSCICYRISLFINSIFKDNLIFEGHTEKHLGDSQGDSMLNSYDPEQFVDEELPLLIVGTKEVT